MIVIGGGDNNHIRECKMKRKITKKNRVREAKKEKIIMTCVFAALPLGEIKFKSNFMAF